MKLYYSPGACSLASHIILRETGQRFDIEKVDLKTKKTASGKDFAAINDKGYVPALELDNGELLTEGNIILQYLADLKPDTKLAPKLGTMERVRLNEWMNFISTEIHKGFGVFFSDIGPQASELFRKKLTQRLEYLAGKLKGKKFITGDQFTIADAYLFTVLNWAKPTKTDLSPWPVFAEYSARISARPAVQEAMKAEGLNVAAAAA